MAQAEQTGKPYGTVLIKGKEILDFILSCETTPSLADISDGLGMPKPTTLKILNTLVMLDLVRRDDQTKRYYLGTSLISYGQKAMASFDIASVARPFLQQLSKKTDETINLGIVRNEQIMLIEKLESSNSVKLRSVVGGTMNMYSSAMGKAVLATYSEKHLDTYFSTHLLTPITEYTLTGERALRANLETVKQNGYSVDDEENEADVFCVGAAIQKAGRLYGAISISTPKYRLPADRRQEFIGLLQSAQKQIEAAL